MPSPQIFTLDLKFRGLSGAIAAYLIPHRHGALLVECGPGSTQETLIAELEKHELKPGDISDVLLTHIHLDHAGSAGWLAHQGARIHVHPNGARHMMNPEKLLASATLLYGDQMDTLWGEFIPVPEDQLNILEDGDLINIQGLKFKAIDTPGHANHHYVYIFEGICFSGDIGGVRMPGLSYLRLPMPPPEFHLEKWRLSLERLRQEVISYIAPTHFGIFSDPERHLANLADSLNEVEIWIETNMPSNPPTEELDQKFSQWFNENALRGGLNLEQLQSYEVANPNLISIYGIQRYWRKYRSEQ
jgi:glyoxylase-like metal-dependent hydrolase (beta-lactamase superfamily II)